MGISINLVLFAFNLLPIPPLDGFTILLGLLPAEMAYQLGAIRQYGPMLLLAILFLPSLLNSRINVFSLVIDPITSLLIPVLTGLDYGSFL